MVLRWGCGHQDVIEPVLKPQVCRHPWRMRSEIQDKQAAPAMHVLTLGLARMRVQLAAYLSESAAVSDAIPLDTDHEMMLTGSRPRPRPRPMIMIMIDPHHRPASWC